MDIKTLKSHMTSDDNIISFEIWFTKEIVDGLLSINTKNRPIVNRNVEFFKRKIDENKWARGAFTVTVNESMTWLIDAQHHLVALRDKGYPLVRGMIKIVPDSISNETFYAMDNGAPRGLATMLGVEGVKNYAPIASMINEYFLSATGLRKSKLDSGEVLPLLEEFAEEIDHIPLTRSIVIGDRSARIPSYVLGSFLAILRHNSDYSKFVDDFFEEVCSGNYSTGSNRHAPRVFRDNIKTIKDSTPNAKRIYILKMFDAYVNGRDVSMQWRRIETTDCFLGVKYFGNRIDVNNDKKHMSRFIGRKKSN